MSGGHFGYNCFRISQFADDLQHEIDINDDDFGDYRSYHFTPETICRLNTAYDVIEKAGKLAKEIEWLYSGDHGEESFASLVDEILQEEK